MYVCICKQVKERDIIDAAERGASHMREVRECTGLGSQCGKCARYAKSVFREAQLKAQQSAGLFTAA